MREIPNDRSLDGTLALIRDGYLFMTNRRARLGSDVFATRLMLRPAICIGGPGAADLFYDTQRFQRAGVAPARITATLLGKGGLHGLDAEHHRHRKALFMELMKPARLARFHQVFAECLQKRAALWEKLSSVNLFLEMQVVLSQAMCAWASIPLSQAEAPKLAADLTTMVDAFGGIGPRNWRGRLARNRRERWARDLIARVREGGLQPAPDSAMHAVAWHRNLDGELLEVQVAAVELLNVIRPAMAIAYFITFAALALHDDEQHRTPLAEEVGYTEYFVQEVRRFYPFTPFLGAKTCREFDWNGYRFPADTLVVLDVHGIDHDPRIWRDPHTFEPRRFASWDRSAFNFVPQGGGDHDTGHRCAGEWITIDALKIAVSFLATGLDYSVPKQDLSFSLRRIPTYPSSGFVMENVQVKSPAAAVTSLLTSTEPAKPVEAAAGQNPRRFNGRA